MDRRCTLVWRFLFHRSVAGITDPGRGQRPRLQISERVGSPSVIPTEVEEWSERDERHERLCREGSGERVGRRTSSIDSVDQKYVERCVDFAQHDKINERVGSTGRCFENIR